MHGTKVEALAKVVGHKGEAKSQDETKRAKVAADIQAIYDRTKTEVTGILNALDGKVDGAFTRGEERARKQFEDYVGREDGRLQGRPLQRLLRRRPLAQGQALRDARRGQRRSTRRAATAT